jgi:predicted patatin/cPLA2 family phospholipase
MLPEAPVRFSTTTGRFRRCPSRGPTVRATMSIPVPGVNGTISLSGVPLLDGAWATAPRLHKARAAVAARRNVFMDSRAPELAC